MARLSPKLRSLEGGFVAFYCPGCKQHHQIRVSGEGRPRWQFDGNLEAPTFEPSIRVRCVRLDMGDDELDRILDGFDLPADREKLLADHRVNIHCHSFIRNGQIEFLADCTHELAGQTVPLPDLEET